MKELSIVSETLFVPLIGRINASENYPNILYDEKALSLKDVIPKECIKGKQTEYTTLASASRTVNIDNIVKDFIDDYDDAIIVELGCGFETTYYRSKKKPIKWFCLDLPEVLDARKKVFGIEDDIFFLSDSMFNKNWIEQLDLYKNNHILFIAAGVFHYFAEDNIINLLKTIKFSFNKSFIVFDTLNHLGIKGVKHYMKELGHKEAKMYFYVDEADALARNISNTTQILDEMMMYKNIHKKGLKLITKVTMKISDKLHMVKVIKMKL